MKYLFLLLFIPFSFCLATAQDKHLVDSLETKLKWLNAKKTELSNTSSFVTDSMRADILYSLSKAYWSSDLVKSENYATQCLEVSKEANYKQGMGFAYNSFGAINYIKGDYSKSIEFHTKALKIRGEIKDKSRIAETYSNIAIVYMQQGKYPDALKNMLHCLKMDTELGDKEGMAADYNNLGSLYDFMNDRENALKNFFTSLKIRMETGDKYGTASNYNNIGALFIKSKDATKALKNELEALKIQTEINDKSGMAISYSAIASAYNIMGKYDLALENNLKALNIFETMGDKNSIINIYVNMGDLYINLKQHNNAAKYFGMALSLSKEIGAVDNIKMSYEKLYKLDSTEGNYTKAFENYKLYINYRDSIINTENTKKTVTLQLNYEHKIEQEKKDVIAAAEISNQKSIRNKIFLVLGIIVVFLIIIIFQRTKIARVKKQQALELERARISKDLHDDLGSGLVSIMMMADQIKDSKIEGVISGNLEKIADSSREMVTDMAEIIWAMNTENDSLESLLMYINSYVNKYADSINIKLNTAIPDTTPSIEITGKNRRNIFLVIKESLNNIVKHAQATEINLNINLNQKSMDITITDNGKGFDFDKIRTGANGLKNMKSRMEDSKGNYSIESSIEKGTKTMIHFSFA